MAVKGTGNHSYLWNSQTLFADFENTYYSGKICYPHTGVRALQTR